MLKGIIFDMDGVLINSEPFHFRVWEEDVKKAGNSYRICKFTNLASALTIGFFNEFAS